MKVAVYFSEEKVLIPLREMCPYSELVWSAFSLIRTKYEEILRIPPYSIQMWENADQNSSEYGHFLRSVFAEHLSNPYLYVVK